MQEEFLGLELMALYRRLRETSDPAIKAVIRRRIDARLGQAEDWSRHPVSPRRMAVDSHDTGGD
jgi:hypothetical protein